MNVIALTNNVRNKFKKLVNLGLLDATGKKIKNLK